MHRARTALPRGIDSLPSRSKTKIRSWSWHKAQFDLCHDEVRILISMIPPSTSGKNVPRFVSLNFTVDVLNLVLLKFSSSTSFSRFHGRFSTSRSNSQSGKEPPAKLARIRNTMRNTLIPVVILSRLLRYPCTVRLLINEESFLLTHCPQIYIRKEISRPGFLDVSRYSVVHSIDLRRVFLHYLNILMCKFCTVCHAWGCMVGCMGRISHTNLKNRIVISEIATSKNHIELLVPSQI
jgi:hypothetical protein